MGNSAHIFIDEFGNNSLKIDKEGHFLILFTQQLVIVYFLSNYFCFSKQISTFQNVIYLITNP